jgi:hypothetical protein
MFKFTVIEGGGSSQDKSEFQELIEEAKNYPGVVYPALHAESEILKRKAKWARGHCETNRADRNKIAEEMMRLREDGFKKNERRILELGDQSFKLYQEWLWLSKMESKYDKKSFELFMQSTGGWLSK